MANKDVLRLIMVHNERDDANRYVSLARNAGYDIRAKHTESPENLAELLQQGIWDLILADNECTSPSIKEIFQQIRRLNKDIPVILLNNNSKAGVLTGLRMGASDVIDGDDDQHLLAVIRRTLCDLETRRKLRYWKRRYIETEKRAQSLLDSSKNAIALVQEGMYTYCNESFAQLFGYTNTDEMDCLPVMDTVAPESFSRIKPLLKTLFTEDSWESQEISFVGLRTDNQPIDINMSTFQVEYNDESALQFLIKNDELHIAAGNNRSKSEHPLTEINLSCLIQHIDLAISKAVLSHRDSLLLHVHINHFDRLREEHGLQVSEKLFQQVAIQLTEKHCFKQTIGRFNDDSLLILLENSDAATGIQLCEKACDQIEKTIFEVDQKTFSLSLRIGLCVISETIASAESAIKKCLQATAELIDEANTSGARTNLYEVKPSPNTAEINNNVAETGLELLNNNSFELLYQPIIGLHSSNKHFYEVLLHLKQGADPENYADDFISQVFQSGAAEEIDRWILEVALNELKQKLTTDPQTRLFINLSLATFQAPDFMTWLARTLNNSNIAHHALIFQLRETDVAHNLTLVTKITKQLQKLGSGVALSHFGLAIEPLSILQQLSVDYIKPDKKLIEEAHNDKASLEDMKALLEQLKSKNQRLIVPFIEQASMMPALWKAGVHYVQGHYIQRPQTAMNYDFSDQ